MQSPLNNNQKEPLFYSFCTLLIDYGFALFVLFFLSWLILLSILAIRLTTKGPGLFAQKRIGLGGQLFTCYKLRTMHINTVQRGTHEVSKDNITKIGHFLRKTKIDELPQFINILKGDMALVGPRPCLPNQKELIHERQIRGVLDIKPGITGLSQIKGIDMSDPVKLAKSDHSFIQMRSLPMLLKIIIATAIK